MRMSVQCHLATLATSGAFYNEKELASIPTFFLLWKHSLPGWQMRSMLHKGVWWWKAVNPSLYDDRIIWASKTMIEMRLNCIQTNRYMYVCMYICNVYFFKPQICRNLYVCYVYSLQYGDNSVLTVWLGLRSKSICLRWRKDLVPA